MNPAMMNDNFRLREVQKENKASDSKTISLQPEDLDLLWSYYSFGGTRLVQLLQLRSIRRDTLNAEARYDFCHVAYSVFRKAHRQEKATEYLSLFNKGFKKPLTEEKLQEIICSAEQENKDLYKKTKFILCLNITLEEQEQIGLLREPSKQEKHTALINIRKVRREGRDNMIIELHEKGFPKRAIADRLGVDRKTVYAVIKRWLGD